MNSLFEANGTFAIQVLKMLCQDRPSQNVFFSPLSISSALGMVLLGAKGNTKVQIARAMSLKIQEDIHKGFQMLLTQVNKPGSKYLLTTANRLFGEKTCDFLFTFKESCLQSYNMELELLSFARAIEKSRKHINCWVSKEMKGKIPEVLPKNSIDEQARLVLVNAIYFKGTWDEPFNKSCVCKMPFIINKEETRPVEMMWQKANFNFIYISEAQTQVLELPYAGKELSMIILLPDEDVDLSVVENSLTFEKFLDWTEAASLQNIEVKVLIPRFKLQGDYIMESVLQRLGMVDVFQEGQADLSAMSTETDLCLSKFVHKSVLEINEEGTEAVAGLDIYNEEFSFSYFPFFHADHPFLFFIRHNETNTLLFCGRFSCP
ncbi:serpin B9-like [Callospermophilus lateralis]|uniref:serpin B9-like n=1 Tax=Callospermophilus lateralis TaxID=76772 RepID=UPI0040385C30